MMRQEKNVDVRLLCTGCHRAIGTINLDCSDDLVWLVVKCPHCALEIAQVLKRDVNNPRSMSYERFLYALEAIVRVEGNLRGRALTDLRHQAVIALAGTILTKENVRCVTHDAFNRRSASKWEASARKGQR